MENNKKKPFFEIKREKKLMKFESIFVYESKHKT